MRSSCEQVMNGKTIKVSECQHTQETGDDGARLWFGRIRLKSCSNGAKLHGRVDLIWRPVWIILLKIYSLLIELKMQIAGLSYLHADVGKMSSLQVHWRGSYSEENACAALRHTHTHAHCFLSPPLFAKSWDLASEIRISGLSRLRKARFFHQQSSSPLPS